ncbi:hypothetical protein ACFFRR_006869 [Megaselia abdita]
MRSFFLVIFGFLVPTFFGLPTEKDIQRTLIQKKLFNLKSVGKQFADCLKYLKTGECWKETLIQVMDRALKDNSTWTVNDFIEITRNENYTQPVINPTGSRGFADVFGEKMLQVAEARSLHFQLVPRSFDEARKKKFKDKGGMAAIGGMILLAMFAQMFMGKVVLLAGAAFIMAKIALLFSVFSSLKHHVSGSTTEVVYSSAGHEHHHHDDHASSSWHRSLPHDDPHTPAAPSTAKETVQPQHFVHVLPPKKEIYQLPPEHIFAKPTYHFHKQHAYEPDESAQDQQHYHESLPIGFL